MDNDMVVLTHDSLCFETARKFVSGDSGIGAVASFFGVTRDNFDGKKVLSLHYEAYDEMALKEMRKCCQDARAKYKQVSGIALMHRLGAVGIGEASVIIAVSSPHRAEAFGTYT